MRINQLKNILLLQNIHLQTISVRKKLHNYSISVLRLDSIHPEISGNKWFKLQYYLQDFIASQKKKLATFGGAYSNHIAATAAACAQLSIPCMGYIRGERPAKYSPTLVFAEKCGMELQFINRADYRDKNRFMTENSALYWIEEGGYGQLGVLGAQDIWNHILDKETFSHVILPVGSGTTIAGILKGSQLHQQILGMSVMKNNLSLQEEITALVDNDSINRLSLLHDYHFGGYAKKNQILIDFMNEMWDQYHIPFDFVYTAKAFYGMMNLIEKDFFPSQSKILFIHTGGLQGNQSLLPGTLNY